MQITVFGASGGVGQEVVKLALSRGFTVQAFVHSRNPFEPTNGLRIVKGDIADNKAVQQAIKGSGAVISALGSWHTKGKDVLARGMQVIIPTMEAQSIKRLVTVTGNVALWEGDQPDLFTRLSHSVFKIVAGKILGDGEKHLRLLASSKLDWTTIRSPAMTGGSAAHYQLNSIFGFPLQTVPRAAVVRCLVDQLEDRSYIRQAPLIHRR